MKAKNKQKPEVVGVSVDALYERTSGVLTVKSRLGINEVVECGQDEKMAAKKIGKAKRKRFWALERKETRPKSLRSIERAIKLSSSSCRYGYVV